MKGCEQKDDIIWQSQSVGGQEREQEDLLGSIWSSSRRGIMVTQVGVAAGEMVIIYGYENQLCEKSAQQSLWLVVRTQ